MSWTMNISHDVITHQHVVPGQLEEEGEAMAVGSSCNRKIKTRRQSSKVVIKHTTCKLMGDRMVVGEGCNPPFMILAYPINALSSHEGDQKLISSLPFHYFVSFFKIRSSNLINLVKTSLHLNLKE